jgi:hypothetical protein
MIEENPFGIWPPYQALYFESMAFLTASAVQSVRELNNALEAWSSSSDEERPEFNPEHILNAVQNIIQHAAALGRYFWPSDENGRHAERAKVLKERFKISEESALRSRTLRNTIEHFDEKLDDYLAKGIAGQIIPQFVGDLSGNREVPIHAFRAFDPVTANFEILGKKFQVQPIVAEVLQIEVRLSALRGRMSAQLPDPPS